MKQGSLTGKLALNIFPRLLIALGFLLFKVDAAAQTERILKPSDFRYSAPLLLDGANALNRAVLPLAVYQGAVRADLGDLRVFNADGEVVPHTVRRPAPAAAHPVTINLPFFPIYSSASSELQDLQLQVRKDASGTIINLISTSPRTSDARLAAYLVDASGVNQPLESLELVWRAPVADGGDATAAAASYSGSVKIEASDDLAQWREIVAAAPIARFEFQGRSLEQRRIALPHYAGKYLRIVWPVQLAPLEIDTLRAQAAGAEVEVPHEWLTVVGTSVANRAGEYAFDLGAPLPIDRIDIDLPENNTLVEASLLTRPSLQSPWQPLARTVLYRLTHNGQDLRSAELAVNALGAHYLMLQVDQQGGGIGRGAPSARVAWLPAQLLFIARGPPPFKLCYGAINVASAEVAIDRLLPGYKEGGALTAQLARIGTPEKLAIIPAPAPKAHRPWKKYSLWAILVAAVALLGWMAYRLTRQMESAKGRE